MYTSLIGGTISGRVKWPEFAKLAHDAGYAGVDVHLSRAMAAGVESTLALLKELRLKPAVVDLPVSFGGEEERFRADLAKLPESAEFAKAIGCPRMITVVMSSSKTPKAELRKLYRDRFASCSEVLARYQVRLGLEFLGPVHIRKAYPHEFIWRMDEMLEFAKECGPNVGLLLDSWHWYHAGATTRDIVLAGKQRIVDVHVSDAPKLPAELVRDDERLFPGEGIIDLIGFFNALKQIDYEDGVSPEILGRGLKQMPPETAARLALESTLGVMRKAGVA